MATPRKDGSSREPRRPPEQSPTDMINRNEFLLFRLKSEIDRLKEQSARRAKGSADPASAEGAPDPAKLLREAREQIEFLRRTGGISREKRPRPQGGPEKGPAR